MAIRLVVCEVPTSLTLLPLVLTRLFRNSTTSIPPHLMIVWCKPTFSFYLLGALSRSILFSVTQYLDGTTQNPLVVASNKTMTSDLRVFSSDSNVTMHRLVQLTPYFQSSSEYACLQHCNTNYIRQYMPKYPRKDDPRGPKQCYSHLTDHSASCQSPWCPTNL